MRMTCGGIISPHSNSSISARLCQPFVLAREWPSIADRMTSTITDSAVTTTLLVRLTQNSRSGRVSTAEMLCRVGGTGGELGSAVILSPGLKTLTVTKYSGTAKNALMTSATSG